MHARVHRQRRAPLPDHPRRRRSTPPIGQLLLDTLTPLALEVALTVQAEIEARADEADAMRRSHVERARHRADLARRRYLAVDPGNRLVADSLEADWNDALRALQAAQDDYDNAAASRRRAHRRTTRPASGRWPPTSPPCGPTRPPRSASASA